MIRYGKFKFDKSVVYDFFGGGSRFFHGKRCSEQWVPGSLYVGGISGWGVKRTSSCTVDVRNA